MKRFNAICLMTGLILASSQPARAEAYSPDLGRIRAGLRRAADHPIHRVPATPLRLAARPQTAPTKPRDSIWNGLLIGAAIGAGGGYLWGRNLCGSDGECFAIAGPAGVLAGAGIGAAVGGILDAFSR